MKTQTGLFIIVFLFGLALNGFGQRAYPPRIEGAVQKTYKTVDETELNVWIFNPQKHKASDKAPCVVFFFGGGWTGGSPSQFVQHCEYLASRGMVAMVADYRVKSRNNVLANKCVSDAKSAIRWVRQNAAELGIDPEKIAAGGGSAGGHLAAATATLPDFDEPGENQKVSSKPNLLLLFNPAVVLAPIETDNETFNQKMTQLEARMGVKPEKMSPYHHISSGLPPTIIFHGMADTTVPFFTVEMFTKKMNSKGNHCILVGYENESHGFFNYGKKNNGPFVDSVQKMDKFLVAHQFLSPLPKTKIIRQ